jgi:hypothetical protein
MLLQYAQDQLLIATNPATKLKIPEPPKRKRRLLREHIAPLVAAAVALGHPHVALGAVLGFYTMQREADLLATTAFRLRPLRDISAEARRALAGRDGKVLGIELQQGKTDQWVGIALAPVARDAVETAIAATRAAPADANLVAATHLILYPGQPRACPEWKFQRDFRATVNRAVADATERQDHELAKILHGIQFRDLRRSGMCWMRDLGVPVALIAAISGHSIEQTQKILDTYMPRDTRGAADGMAMAVTRQAERDAADLEQGSEG